MGTEIKQMLIDGIGWIYKKDGDIGVFEENGEMAKVKWYGQNKKIYNGKYVITIEYE